MSEMRLDRGIPVQFGNHVGYIYGGPYRAYKHGTRRLIGIKMAAEIDHPHDVSVPTKDFSVPDESLMQEGLIKALYAISCGQDAYVGCMGGIGRTGLFMGCMVKSLQDACLWEEEVDPVMAVRNLYQPTAIETVAQMKYVRNFDSSPVVCWIDSLLEEETYRGAIQERVVYLSPWAWVVNKAKAIVRAF